MSLISRIRIGLKAFQQLGPGQVGLYGLYQLGLRTGHYQRLLSAALSTESTFDHKNIKIFPCIASLPEPGTLLKVLGEQAGKLFEQADEIVNGKIRLFGGPPVPLVLTSPAQQEDWTKFEFMGSRVDGQDIKFIWEPARFGWACTLATAYHLSKKEDYVTAFWHLTDQFLVANPPYQGPHWCSAQEVAIRLVALAFALQVFSKPGLATREQLEKITRAIAIHAIRIPPTLVYARAQNNNHLIMEALGLYTASVLLPDHPLAPNWHALGWHWLMAAFKMQIDPDGTYAQQSTNYHRLLLQAALWAYTVNQQSRTRETIPPAIQQRLTSSVGWLWEIVDPATGRVPNLGHNDGSLILPLTICPYHDYRPVIHAAVVRFMQGKLHPEGPWSDMDHWLGVSHASIQATREFELSQKQTTRLDKFVEPPYVLTDMNRDSWAMLRAAHYHSRPAHADQLHMDLWWHGLNLALDPGTYLYNAQPPWENSLASAFVHNTITVDGRDFMQRAGKFLYLDWAQAKVITSENNTENKSPTISAAHNGYRKLGITHTRSMSTLENGDWEIIDRVEGPANQAHSIRMHWLLPDWEYELQDMSLDPMFPGYAVTLRSPRCKFTLRIGLLQKEGKGQGPVDINFQLARAGELLDGSGSLTPTTGYYSPTYGRIIPALAFVLYVNGCLPIVLKSQWFPPRAKAAVILIKNDQIALVERERQGRHYYVIPGGKLEPGETPEIAAAREAKEELGLEVKIGRLVANIWYQGRSQYYFLADETGGSFGQMSGVEATSLPGSPKGSYQPVWMPVDQLTQQPVLPELVADLVWKSHHTGWPKTPLFLPEPPQEEVV